ncbi:MAG: hypothetical protein WC889_14255 [Myxococcota bacterium]|jgi:hypothetical protein
MKKAAAVMMLAVAATALGCARQASYSLLAATPAGDGHFVLAGSATAPHRPGTGWLLSLDGSGRTVFDRSVPGTPFDGEGTVRQLGDNLFIAAGQSAIWFDKSGMLIESRNLYFTTLFARPSGNGGVVLGGISDSMVGTGPAPVGYAGATDLPRPVTNVPAENGESGYIDAMQYVHRVSAVIKVFGGDRKQLDSKRFGVIPRSIIPVGDGYLITGYINGKGLAAESFARVIMLDSKLGIRWWRDFDFIKDKPDLSDIRGAAATADGGVILLGTVLTGEHMVRNGDVSMAKVGLVEVIRLSPAGETVWQKEFAAALTPAPLFAAGDGGATVVFNDNGALGVVRFAPDGVMTWKKTVGGPGWRIRAVAPAEDGIVVAGDAHGSGAAEAFLAKIDRAGAVSWRTAVAGFSEPAQAHGNELIDADQWQIVPARDGWFVLATGRSKIGCAGAEVTMALRFGAGGNLIWERRFAGVDGQK